MFLGTLSKQVKIWILFKISTFLRCTPDAAEDLADQIVLLGLGKDDIVYLDLLSNSAYMGTDAEGNSTEPTKVGKGWHIPGCLVAAARP